MLRKLPMSLALALTATVAVAPTTMAESKVAGPMDLAFNVCWAGPGEEVPDWVGTVDLDDHEYDILFFNVGSGQPPTERVEPPLMAAHEIWAIYDGLELIFDEKCAIEAFEGEAVLWGHDYGVVNFAESPDYRLSGTVVEAAGDFAELAGRDVEISGVVEFSEEGAPQSAPGEFAIS